MIQPYIEKTCRVCGFIGSEELFVKKANLCKKCKSIYDKQIKNKNKEIRSIKEKQWRKEHPEEAKAKDREIYKKYRKGILERKKEYVQKNIETIRKKNIEYNKNHHEARMEYWKTYRIKNKNIINEKARIKRSNPEEKERRRLKAIEYRKENPEKRKEYYAKNKERCLMLNKLFYKSEKGREFIRKKDKRRREFGYKPINAWFKNSHYHHLHLNGDKDIGIYIPKKLHQSIPHSSIDGRGMTEINKAALEWLTQQSIITLYGVQ